MGSLLRPLLHAQTLCGLLYSVKGLKDKVVVIWLACNLSIWKTCNCVLFDNRQLQFMQFSFDILGTIMIVCGCRKKIITFSTSESMMYSSTWVFGSTRVIDDIYIAKVLWCMSGESYMWCIVFNLVLKSGIKRCLETHLILRMLLKIYFAFKKKRFDCFPFFV